MPGISIHVVDVSRGTVAAGMKVALYALSADGTRRLVADGHIAENGSLPDAALQQRFDPGYFEAVFHIGDFYGAAGAGSQLPFLDVVTYRFGLADPAAHYHLPMKCTPWGYSCFRGGA